MPRKLVSLLDALYPSVLETPPWVSFLEKLEEALPGHHCTMVLRKPREGDPGIFYSTEGNSAALATLQERVFSDSPFLELPEGEVSILSEMERESELKALHPEYYHFLREYGEVADLIGLDIRDSGTGVTARLRASRISGETPFGPAERKLLQELQPRLRIALTLYARLAWQQYEISLADEAVDRLTIGSILLDEQGQVLLKNAVADQILRQEDGLCLRKGRLHATDAASDQMLHSQFKEFRAAMEGGAEAQFGKRSLLVPGSKSHAGWSLLLRPARARPGLDENIAGTVLVLVRSGGQSPDIPAPLLIELFGLTPAEAQLAEQLVKGASLNDSAEALGRSRYTARSQLASIFAKTHTNRQPQLVGHIINTVNALWQ